MQWGFQWVGNKNLCGSKRQLPMPPDRLLSLSVSCLTHINARCGGLGIETLQRWTFFRFRKGERIFFRQNACGMGKCLYFRVVKSRQSLSNQTAGYCFLVGLCKFTFEEQSEECAFFSRAVFSTSTSSVITFSKSPQLLNPSCGCPQSASGRCQSRRGRCRWCARCGRKGSAR